jgi:exodeoxyribonuclease V alpha subunit
MRRASGVFNGDVGRIMENQPEKPDHDRGFREDRIASYEFGQISELELAYAMTVHKSQGSEYRAVVFAAVKSPPMLLTRSVLYTAITRAKELLVIVGDRGIISTMTSNLRRETRYSGLKDKLIGLYNGGSDAV